jgi:hypothetical protein
MGSIFNFYKIRDNMDLLSENNKMDKDIRLPNTKLLTRREKKILYLRKMREKVHNVCTICGGKYTYGNDKNHISTDKHINALTAFNEKCKDEETIKRLRDIGDIFSNLVDNLYKNRRLPTNEELRAIMQNIKEYNTKLDHVAEKVRSVHNKNAKKTAHKYTKLPTHDEQHVEKMQEDSDEVSDDLDDDNNVENI